MIINNHKSCLQIVSDKNASISVWIYTPRSSHFSPEIHGSNVENLNDSPFGLEGLEYLPANWISV